MRCVLAAAAALFLAVFSQSATAQTTPTGIDPLAAVEATGGSVNVLGAGVSVTGRAAGVRAAGGSVELTAAVDGDAWLAGLSVLSDAPIAGGLWGIGGTASVAGKVTGRTSIGALSVRSTAASADFSAVGGTVSIAPAASIAGGSVVGATVTFAGRASGPLRIVGAVVMFNGQATGAVSIIAGRVIIGPKAVIGGGLSVVSGAPAEIDRAARITGGITQGLAIFGWPAPEWLLAFALAALLAVGGLATGLVGIFLFGGTFVSGTTLARWSSGWSSAYGALAFFGLPLLGMLLVATIVGVPFGASILLALPLLLLAGHATAATALACVVFMRRERPLSTIQAVVCLVVGLLGLAALSLLPTIGPWLAGIMLLIGLGGFVRALSRRLRLGALEVP